MTNPSSRVAAAVVLVVVAALAVATIHRPTGGYREAAPLLLALSAGGLGAITLIGLLALGAHVVSRWRGSPATSVSSSAIPLIVLALATMLIVIGTGAVKLWPHGSTTASAAPQRAAFAAWQRATVPLVLTYTDAVRVLGPAIRSQHRRVRRLAVVQHQEAALTRLLQTLRDDARRYRNWPRLPSLTADFIASTREARAAAVDLAAATRAARATGGTSSRAKRRIRRRMFAQARHSLFDAQAGMWRFTLAANALGSRVFAHG